MDPYSVVDIGIYEALLLSKSAILLDLAGAHFESKEWLAGFEIKTTKVKDSSNVPMNNALQTRLRQKLSYSWSSKMRAAWDVLFQLLGMGG